jgi:ribonuclease P protein component
VHARTGRFQRSDRILASGEYGRISRRGVRFAVSEFVLLVASRRVEGTPGRPRLGITASRKVGNAVVRNRVKRSVREWFRRDRGRLGAGFDIVVIARRGARNLSGQEIRARLIDLIDLAIADERVTRAC